MSKRPFGAAGSDSLRPYLLSGTFLDAWLRYRRRKTMLLFQLGKGSRDSRGILTGGLPFSGSVKAETHGRMGRGRSVRWGWLLFTSAIAAALWGALVGTGKRDEMLLGVVCVAATVWFSWLVSRSSGLEFEFRGRDVAQVWRVPWYILVDLSTLTVVLVKDVLHIAPAGNLFRVCGFDSSKRDPVRMARDVLAVLYTTTSPNLIVIGIDIAQSRMLFHQLSRSDVPRMTKALGARG